MPLKKRRSYKTGRSLFISDGQIMGTLMILAAVGGGALVYFGPKYAPELYKAVNNSLLGIPDKINGLIQGKGFYAYPYMDVNTVHYP